MTNTDNNQHIKDSVKEIVAEQSLSDAELDGLMDLQAELMNDSDGSGSLPTQRNKSWYVMFSSMAASFALVAFLAFQAFNIPDRTYDIAMEGVKNHLKNTQVDIKSSSLEAIKASLPELNFSPVVTSVYGEYILPASSKLLGGKYCTIKGIIATHLRFSGDKDNSLFQASYTEELHGDIPSPADGDDIKTHFIKGLEVNIWQEKGLLLMSVN